MDNEEPREDRPIIDPDIRTCSRCGDRNPYSQCPECGANMAVLIDDNHPPCVKSGCPRNIYLRCAVDLDPETCSYTQSHNNQGR